MKQQKLFLDSRPAGQPAGTYPYGKNGIQFDMAGTVFNEPGFTKLSAVTPYQLNGVIETDTNPILFSTDDTNSAIGYFNPVTGAYTGIINDNPASLLNWPNNGDRLGFKKANYIIGEAQRNYKGEIVCAFTDKHVFPMYLNCDAPVITKLDDMRFFPVSKTPVITLTENSGGSLEPGTYYITVNYERNDGTITQRTEVSDGIIISPGDFGLTTNKAILINLSNVDMDYNFIRISVISKIKGLTKAIELTDLTQITATTAEILFTGDNLFSEISLSEILTPPAIYSVVNTMGQLNDALYLAGLQTEPDINDMQRYANLVTLKWKSELLNAVSPPPEHINGTRRSFMHEEVYAFYIRYHKTRGGFTKWYTIPGLSPLSGDLVASSEAASGGYGSAVPKYKVEDTIHSFSGFDGDCGIWKNDTELYPDTPDFDSSGLGGRNLRNQPVLHHKMPSVRWCKANLYPSELDYGRTKLDILGITPSNITIPVKYNGILDGYQIAYAKRTPSNMSVYGQSLMMHGACDVTGAGLPTASADIYTSGGNWSTSVWHQGKGDYNDDWELVQLRQDTMRFHAFDMLFNKPSISPVFVSAQLKVKRDHLREEGYLEDGADDKNMEPTSHLVDYTRGLNPQAIATGKFLRAINNGFYLTGGLSANNFINARHEDCYAATLLGSNWPLSYGDSGIRISGQSYTEANVGSPGYEEAYLVNLIALKADMYSNFYSQRLITAAASRLTADLSTMWGGDTFVSDYTFHTYGRHDSIDTWGGGNSGIKVIRRFVCESVSNIHLRYEVPGNEYSKWYPRTAVTANNPLQCYITTHDRSKDPNQFGYTRDLNAVNDFIPSTIFNTFLEEITNFPYRIHRTGKISRQNKFRNWRSLLPLDYYECQKNMGAIIRVLGMTDRLLIHHENALFRTQDKAKLDAGLLSVTLGTGDIFQFEPQVAKESKLGYGGTQHELACIKTSAGYAFIDGKYGGVFLVNNTLECINDGMNTFLRDNIDVAGKNPYNGNGVTMGWDQRFERLLLTVKNSDTSFTASYCVAARAWVFFHDYVPDMYVHSRDELFTAKASNMYSHNTGPAGIYYEPLTPKSFFIDVVFPGPSDMLLETVNWMTDYITSSTDQTFKTLSHLSVWNSHQHSGRISLRENQPLVAKEIRRTKGEWYFNDFRNVLISKGVPFLNDIFADYSLIGAQANAGLPWYKKELLGDTWFCVRFEFDNSEDAKVFLNEVNINTSIQPR